MALSGYRARSAAIGIDQLLAALRYRAASSRDLRIDLLRGFCVFAMVVDHIGGASWFYALTGGNQFAVSAAEGFVFLSGFLVGVVYRGVIETRGVWVGVQKALGRAAQLYVLAVFLAVGFGFASVLAGQWWGNDEIGSPLQFAIEVVTLQRAYYLADVMLLYALLLGVTPIAVIALRLRLAPLLAVVSIGLWGAVQIAGPIEIPWHIHENTVFHFAPWQALFFLAMIFGWHRRTLGARLSRWMLSPAAIVLAAALAIAIIALYGTDPVNLRWALGDDATVKLYDFFDKSRMPIGRLVAVTVFFQLAFAVVTLAWLPIRIALGWLLVPFGKHSLLAYSAHLFMLAGVGLVTSAIPGFDPWDIDANTVAQLSLVLVIWLLVLTSNRWKQSPRLAGVAALRLSGTTTSFHAPRWLSWWQFGAVLITVVTTVAISQAVQSTRSIPVPAIETPVEESSPTIIYVRPTTLADEPLGEVLPVDLVNVPEYAGNVGNRSLWSPILGREMPYLIYLPPDYWTSERRYPTVYLLHGVGGYYGEWFGYGFLNEADRLIAAGQIEPMIIILPQGDQDYWVNRTDGGPRWADYVVDDVVRNIDGMYRTLAGPEYRAIGGLSMGAHGALQIGFNHPDVFGVIGAHSPSIRTYDESPTFFGDEEEFRWRDPVSLAEVILPDVKQIIWLDRGDDDIWYEQTDKLASVLQERGIAFRWSVLPGEHDGYYWEANAPVYLRFYSDSFHSHGVVASSGDDLLGSMTPAS